jgi:type IV pilus assembly protein PilA
MLSSVMSRLNDRRDAAADLGEDAGFTLIELMVVLLILAILLAIAIPTFLGVTGGANDRAAQSNLNTALTTAKTAATQNGQSYGTQGGGTALSVASLKANEPSLTFVAGATTAQGNISFYVSTDGNGVVLASPSTNNKGCWYAVDNIQFVTGGAANGMYTDTTASPGVPSSGTPLPAPAASAPTAAGTWYGYQANATTCNAGATTVAGLVWGSKFPV